MARERRDADDLTKPTAPVDPGVEPIPVVVEPENAVKFTRTAALWTALIAGFLVLIILLVFIAQNTEGADVNFLGWEWTLPMGVWILLSAVIGGLITVLAATARIVQLRRAAKKNLLAR